jgi:ubiquinone/menaquinone biosynthesis C-methylase UbiE
MSHKTYDSTYLDKLQGFFEKTKVFSYHQLNPKLNEVIADIGCGIGNDTINLTKSGAKIIGIDHDQSFIEIAKKHQLNNLHLEFICSQADNIPFTDHTFDKVRFDRVFQHITDYDKVLKEVSRILKPNGQIQIVDTDYLSFTFFLEDESLERKIIDLVAYKHIPNAHKVRRLPSILKQNNFSLNTVKIHNYIIDDFEFANYVIRFDKIVHQEFENGKITSNELELWLQNKDNFHFSFNLVLYQASKKQ